MSHAGAGAQEFAAVAHANTAAALQLQIVKEKHEKFCVRKRTGLVCVGEGWYFGQYT